MNGAVRLLLVVLAGAVVSKCNITGRFRREIAQQDQSQTGTTDGPTVVLALTPAENVNLMEGDDITFNCRIVNKPRNGQVQWYYMIRNPVDNTFDNFTILANEMATVDPNKYKVWTTAPNVYSLKIDEMREGDTGEYCCFLYVSYTETYREATSVTVSNKPPPPTTTKPTTVRSGEGRYGGYGGSWNSNTKSRGYPSSDVNSKIDEIIEEAVEHDIEVELGKKLNITMIKNNAEARTLIHNATEEIKSLLNVDENTATEFNNGTTKLIVTRKMQGVNSQVKTVVTSLITKISRVDATLAAALAPLQKGESQADRAPKSSVSSVSSVASPSNSIPDWRQIYNEYKKDKVATGSDSEEVIAMGGGDLGNTGGNGISNTPPPYNGISEEERQRQEEQNNVLEYGTSDEDPSRPTISSGTKFSGQKCEYQLVINEFDPSQCPSIGTNIGGQSAAASYYEADNRKAAAFTREPIGNSPPVAASNEQLTRLENKLIEEMANSKLVNKTVLMHDGMLHKTEKMLKEQTNNISNLEELVKDLRGQLAKTEREKTNMEDKVTNVMLNILEVNKRLDIAMKDKGTRSYEKEINVQSASETVACDKHPNVTHFIDCTEVAAGGVKESGVYYIRPLYSACPIPVWCDMDTYPSGWTVVQRREGGAVSFNKNWKEYREGFGHVTSEHWLGNDNLFLLSNQNEYMVRVDLWDFYDSRVFSEYRVFKVDGERDDYRLTVANYSGTAGNGLKSHNQQKFSTSDRDNDMWKDYHCSYEWEGGWWFTNCWSSYLNGRYYNESSPPYNGIAWREWKEEQLFKSEIKIRPVYHIKDDQPAADEENVAVEIGKSEEEAQGDQPRQNIMPVRRKYNRAAAGK